jgi:2',3'-cyclic-nucleotide 2'-phosphodiesterase (5'-nucleotidase family)
MAAWKTVSRSFLPGLLVLALVACSTTRSTGGALLPDGPPERRTVQVDPASLEPDAGMIELLAPFAAPVAVLRAPIGRASTDMPRNGDALRCWMADVVREAAGKALGIPVHAGFVNNGGIRADLPAGPISEYTLLSIMPFDNEINVLELTGEQLLELARDFAPRRGQFPLSGMTITVAADRTLADVRVAGEPVRPDATYLIATSSYLTGGGDNLGIMSTFPPPRETGIRIRDAMIAAVRQLDVQGRAVEPPADLGRYIFLETAQEATPR